MQFHMDVFKKHYKNVYSAVKNQNVNGNKCSIEESLDNVRDYLDNCGMKMPRQIYPYDSKIKSTWKYLVNPDAKSEREWTILNPNWKYKACL